MKQFSVENFRKFDSFPPMNLGGITFLIGENNAGKSSVVKSIILSQHNLQHLFNYNGDDSLRPMFSFDVEQLHIGTFERAVCNSSKKKYFSFHVVEDGLSYTFAIAHPAKGGNHTQAPIAYIELDWTEEHCGVKFDFEAREIRVRVKARTKTQINKLRQDIIQRTAIIQNGVSAIRRERLESFISEVQKIIDNPLGGETCIKMPPKMKPLEGIHNYYHGVIPYLFAYTFGYFPYVGKSNVSKKFLSNFSFLFRTPGLLYDTDYFLNAYIYSHGASQNVLYRYEDKNDYTAQSVHNYKREGIKKGSKAEQFVISWMRSFNIGKDFTINSIYGDSYTLVITDFNGHQMPLADKGIGSIQLMSLLLRLAVLINKGNADERIILIEEPEQNLHPTLQGQVAQLLYEVNTKYDYQIIVETHSEYMVRKSQLIVANIGQENNCKTQEDLDKVNPFRIHYLPADAPHYEIKYQLKGALSRPFGKGFYDVADELAMSLEW